MMNASQIIKAYRLQVNDECLQEINSDHPGQYSYVSEDVSTGKHWITFGTWLECHEEMRRDSENTAEWRPIAIVDRFNKAAYYPTVQIVVQGPFPIKEWQ